MKNLLKKAKELLINNKVQESLELVKRISQSIKSDLAFCPSCGAETVRMEKKEKVFAECSKCGAMWGHTVIDNSKLLKSEEIKMDRDEILKKSWDLYRQGRIDAYPINFYDQTGLVTESLAKALGIEKELKAVGDEKLEKSKYSDDASDWIGNKIKFLMESEGKPQAQAIAMAHEMARKKGYKVPMKKSDDRLSKDDVLDYMLNMFKSGEGRPYISRHSISKFETLNEIDEEALKIVYRKAGKDFYSFYKAEEETPAPKVIKLEDGGEMKLLWSHVLEKYVTVADEESLKKFEDAILAEEEKKLEKTGEVPPEAGGKLRRPRPLADAPAMKKPKIEVPKPKMPDKEFATKLADKYHKAVKKGEEKPPKDVEEKIEEKEGKEIWKGVKCEKCGALLKGAVCKCGWTMKAVPAKIATITANAKSVMKSLSDKMNQKE